MGKLFLVFSLLITGLGGAQQALAGINTDPRCSSSHVRNVAQGSSIAGDDSFMARVMVKQGLFSCPTPESLGSYTVHVELLPMEGRVPNHGWVTGRVTALNGSGEVIYEREYRNTIFLSESHTFSEESRIVVVTIEGLEPIVLLPERW